MIRVGEIRIRVGPVLNVRRRIDPPPKPEDVFTSSVQLPTIDQSPTQRNQLLRLVVGPPIGLWLRR